MTRYRWKTAALLGRWWPNQERALQDALEHGHAFRVADEIALLPIAVIECEDSEEPSAN